MARPEIRKRTSYPGLYLPLFIRIIINVILQSPPIEKRTGANPAPEYLAAPPAERKKIPAYKIHLP